MLLFQVLFQDMNHKRATAGIQMMIPEEADHTLQNLHWWFYPQSLQLISLKKKWPGKNVNVILGYLWDGRICWLRLSEFLTHIFELGMKKAAGHQWKSVTWVGLFGKVHSHDQKLCDWWVQNVCVNNVSNELYWASWALEFWVPCYPAANLARK